MTSLVTEGTVLDPYEYASDVVRGYTGQQFDYVANDVVTLDPRADGTAQLPEMPVTAVSLVSAYMPDYTGNFTWQTLTQYGWVARGLLYNTAPVQPFIMPSNGFGLYYPTWPQLPGSLQVTYSHGYQTIPADIQAVVTRIAQQIQANPYFMASRKVGEISYSFGNAPQGKSGALVTLRDTDCAILDRYKVIEVS